MGKYYLGLDIGTNSVGWAVTDEVYNLIRKKGKDLWGVRLFSEAKTAAERRGFRSSKRRNDRKRMRLQLLREIFEEEISKVDKNFYLRLDESKYWEEDKKINGKYSLFDDLNFTDKEYFKKYKTIFHLRKDLIEHSEKKDIRLYFLAINQMMKKRGHFLIDGELNNITDYKPYLYNLMNIINEELDINLDEDFYNEIFTVLLDNSLKKTDKKNKVKNIIPNYKSDKTKIKILNSIFTLVISGKVKVKDIFNDDEIKVKVEEDKKTDFELSDEKYQENLEYFENLLGYKYELIINLKAIYDFILLKDILKGHKYLSDAKVESYNNHQNDLKLLKNLIRKYDSDNKVYNQIFRDKSNEKGYVAYLGYYNNKKRIFPVKKCSYEDFTNYIKKELNKIVDNNDKDYLYIISKIENEQFLLKQIVSTNSVIPHQVHLIELRKIIENLLLDYPSFEVKEDGFTRAEKIEKIFKFRIPYYVGPLNDYHKNKGGNAWIVKNEEYKNEKIRPWNFETVVDLHKSEEEFIKRMINECTYLPNEKVLPKSSLLYQEYMVLNELNNLKINNQPLQVDVKKKIIDELYKKYSKVTLKKIRNFLIINNYIEKTNEINFTGIDTELKANMSSYVEFKNILGDNFNINMVEDIIEQITIHTGNIKLLIKKIGEKYPNLSEKQLKEIVSKKYKDWGRFSKKLLNGLEGTELETGQIGTITYYMRENNDNFMQILSGNYDFISKINKLRQANLPKNLDYSVIDSLYVSPSVKKMIWQVININKELIKVLGKEPDKIFIEIARSKDEKPERKDSRKTQLLNLYKSIKKENGKLYNELENFNDIDFRNRALYLYFTQMGRCMYSGEKIDLEDIYDKNMYDLDHIIPRKLKKDDSIINNLVLVKRNLNQTVKGDKYPIPSSIRNNEEIKNYWYRLLKNGLISKEKYDRLNRNQELTNEELAGFINRQLVETRQSTKVVKELFEKYYINSKVITVKAELTSELRKDFEVLKCRELNDLHHAHDAFLNIIVGDVWNKKFTSNPMNFIKNNRKENLLDYSIKHIFKRDQFSKGEKIWDVAEGKKKIIDTLNKPSVLFSNDSFEQKGELFNATIVSKDDIKKGTSYLPLKKNERLCDVTKYGGYKSISGAYFFLVEHVVRNEIVRSIEMVPIYIANKIKNNKRELINYCDSILGLDEPNIIIDKIKYKTEIELNGFRYLISGKTDKQLSLEPNMQMFWKLNDTYVIKLLINKFNKYNEYKTDLFDEEDKYMILNYIRLIKRKLDHSIYSKRLNVPKFDIDNLNKDNYINNCHLLVNLIKLTNKTLQLADLSSIGLGKHMGKARIPQKLKNEIYIINKSITGAFEKRIRIN